MKAPTASKNIRHCMDKLNGLDIARCTSVLDLHADGDVLQVPFYDRTYRISPRRIIDHHGPPTEAVGRVLCRYLLNCPPRPAAGDRPLTFRELDGAGPLVSSFANNTHKVIASAFEEDPEALERAGRRMNGRIQTDRDGFDLVITFGALPRIPLYLHFNGTDEMFPAQCVILFNPSAQVYLDMPSLFTLGTYLTGGLLDRKSA